jgi:hypothetical protein
MLPNSTLFWGDFSMKHRFLSYKLFKRLSIVSFSFFVFSSVAWADAVGDALFCAAVAKDGGTCTTPHGLKDIVGIDCNNASACNLKSVLSELSNKHLQPYLGIITHDGDWAPSFAFPLIPPIDWKDETVAIRVQSTFGTTLTSDFDKGVFGLPILLPSNDSILIPLSLRRGDQLTLTNSPGANNVDPSYCADRENCWTASGSSVAQLSPNDTGATIPDNPKPLTLYSMWNSNWVNDIYLPNTAANGSVIVVHSYADLSAIVHYNQTKDVTIAKGQTIVFMYNNGWINKGDPSPACINTKTCQSWKQG